VCCFSVIWALLPEINVMMMMMMMIPFRWHRWRIQSRYAITPSWHAKNIFNFDHKNNCPYNCV